MFGDQRRETGSIGSASDHFTQLEQRVLLSGDSPALVGAFGETAPVAWRGAIVQSVRDSWIIGFDERVSDEVAETRALALAGELGVSLSSIQTIARGLYAEIGLTGGAFSADSADSVVDRLDGVRGLIPNRLSQTLAIPNDPLFTEQWSLENNGQFISGQFGIPGADINVTEAWDITTGSRDVVIAIIDTGVDMDHPDLVPNLFVNPGEIPGNGIDDDNNGFVDDVSGWDFGENDNNPDDAQGHGTAVAGVVGAVGNNGIGVSGVAWNVSLLPIKIATANGSLSNSAIIGAHDYVTTLREAGINVAASNNSYGTFNPFPNDPDFDPQDFFGDGGFDPEREAIERFIDSGGVFVAAAGNDSTDVDNDATVFPASYEVPGIISVAATDNQGQLSDFSNFGLTNVDLGAPGTQVFTTSVGGGYEFIDGTSFSSPTVAGAVALLATLRPNASGEELRQVLIESAQTLGSLQGITVSGGQLDVLAAIRALASEGPQLERAEPGPVASQFVGDQVLDTLRFTFDEPVDPAFLDESGVEVVRSGSDLTLGTADDVTIIVDSVSLDSDGRTVLVELDLSGISPQRLPIDTYRVTLDNTIVRDLAGNLLGGDAFIGVDEVYEFRIVGPATGLEPNDQVFDSEFIQFTASGRADYTGLVLGDGANADQDVDLFLIDVPKAGLIRAEVFAQNRPGGSTLDSVLRLYNAAGDEIAFSDQFNGSDPLIDFFVPSGGIYILGVSGFANVDYDILTEGSGPEGQSTGVYDLSIEVDLVNRERVNVDADFSGAPLRIPVQGTQGTLSNSIIVNDTRALTDVNVRFDIEHTFVGDLEISLIAPNGEQIQLVNRRGNNGDDFMNTLIDDESSLDVSAADAPFNAAGGYRPEAPLNQLDGISAAGQWTLLIQDRAALNTGVLNSWGLELEFSSDINGPFESNDTIATAQELETIPETGVSSLEAALGDGGFGSLDRDLFRFDGITGQTLSVQAVSQGSADLALRVFDETGSELLLIDPELTTNATLERFVLPDTGTYYIAISDSANITYDPADGASGVNSLTSGGYRLDVSVANGISDDARILSGDKVEAAAGSTGTFFTGSGADRGGLSVDGNEFLFAPNGFGDDGLHFFGASASGFTFRNDGPGGDADLPVALTDRSDSFNRSAVGEGDLRGLNFQRSFAYGLSDSFVAIDVLLTNTTSQTLTGVTWMEGLDPQQGLNLLVNPTEGTQNDVRNDLINGGNSPFAIATVQNAEFQEGLSIAIAAPALDGANVGGNASATFFDPDSLLVRDPTQLIGQGIVDPDNATEDLAMALTFDVGALAPGEQVSLRYFVLMGTVSDVANQYAAINGGTGTGHLAAQRSSPAGETLETAASDPITEAPTLPYRLFYPEGFAGPETYTFAPIVNPNDEPVRVVVIARYESGDRDQVLQDSVIPAGSRGGILITDPDLFAADLQKVRKNTPYAVEIRSELPVGATFSHYDLFLLAGGQQSSLGESFVSQTDTTFTFGDVVKGDGVRDFLLVQNTLDIPTKYDLTFIAEDGEIYTLTKNLGANRRGGIDVRNNPFFTRVSDGAITPLPDGNYGVILEADSPVVASISHYDSILGTSSGVAGTPGSGDVAGVIAEGQIGVNADGAETFGILNASDTDAEVLLRFQFQSGTSFRTTVNVPAMQRGTVNTLDLAAFPVGEPYAVEYESNTPVSLQVSTQIFGDEYASASTDRGFTLWTFGEGFRPPVNRPKPADEFLRLYNPGSETTVAEIQIRFSTGGEQTFRRTLEPRSVQEFDIYEEFIINQPPNRNLFFGITVKSADPIVAYMGHFDGFFPGGFGTLGTPFGGSSAISDLNPLS